METLIEGLIADFHERSLPTFTRRRVSLPLLPNKIDTVIGMRRTGKTWFLFQVMADLLAQGQSRESILYVNLEDERLLPMQASDLQRRLSHCGQPIPWVVDPVELFFTLNHRNDPNPPNFSWNQFNQ